ncbi:Venom dipeptidyl peptidase 4 [Papilio machaon]|uniref:Venom dipeptidyl peptidase 4 n=1 Tax=Papilio machaon TaxID=76193 RepID=A0A194R348_PAPMA|nr:Venom dipeptidyl peptidase 4 [Papilio machaon]
MRRKRERSTTAKSKASPEKKVEKVRRTRGRRRKQSTSSGNESGEEVIAALVPEKVTEPAQSDIQTSNKEESPPETQDQVWQVKTAEGSGDGGEIQKLKICLKRPPSTPEAGDKSPRSKRKHTRATSSSDSTSVETPDDKKKNRHRTRRSACDSSETSEKGNDIAHIDSEISIQKENVVVDSVPAKNTGDSQIETNSLTVSSNEELKSKEVPTESNEIISEVSKSDMNDKVNNLKDEVNMEESDVKTGDSVKLEVTEVSTSNELITETVEVNETLREVVVDSSSVKEDSSEAKEAPPEIKESLSQVQNESTTSDSVQNVVCSEKTDTSTPETCSSTVDKDEVECKPSDKISDVESKSSENISKESDQEKHEVTDTLENDATQEGSMTFDKSDILEIHAEESKADISDQEVTEAQNEVPGEQEPQQAISQESGDKVSKSEDKMVESCKENGEPPQSEIKLSTNEPDVVAQSDNVVKESSPQEQSENADDAMKKVPEQSESSQVINEGSNNSNIVINRKRRWGSRPKLTTQKSITISTDVLKEIIPDVKPVEFEEVIEEKKQKRFEVSEKIERPILPKIVIDNTENVEHKRNQERNEIDKPMKETNNLTSSRKISIVKDSENAAVIRPPSPPKHKQSNILYITNLVRPFTLSQLRNLLQRTGRITENGFWIDRIKSKCFVIYENEDQAVETRHALHGVTWPVSNPKTLHVDFSTQEDFDHAKNNEENENNQVTSIPGTVEDWLREQDMKREKGEMERPWERKSTREWDLGKNDKIQEKEKDRLQKDDRVLEKRRHHTPERSPEPAKKFKKKEEAPAKLLDDLFRKTKTTPCIYWLPLSAETIVCYHWDKSKQFYDRLFENSRVGGSKPSTAVYLDRGFLYNQNGKLMQTVFTQIIANFHLDRYPVREQLRGPWFVWAVLVGFAVAQSPFTLEDFVRGQFAQRAFNGTWISDKEFTYTISGEPGIYMFDVSTLTRSVLVSGELLAFLNTSNPILSADRQYILAPSEVQSVYRYSTTARFALYEIATGNVRYIANHQRLQLCIFGGGHSLAYVLDNNIYYLPEDSSQAIQITSDGIPGVIYNGHTDWVYEEDVMYTGQATWFSTDGSYLAFASFNDTEVEAYSYYYFVDKTDPDDLYPELFDLKYPKVGRTNPTVNLRLVNLTDLVLTNQVRWETLAPPAAVTEDHILGGVVWPTANEVAAHWLNRRQNYTVLRICNVNTGFCEEETRQQPNGWVPIALPRFSRNGDFFVSTRWSLEQADGKIWQHLYVSIRVNPFLIISSSITPGGFTVNNYVGMDEDNLSYYYTRTVAGAPWQSQVHVSGARAECLSCNIQLPDGGRCTWATATASRAGSYLTITCSSTNEPSATYIVDPLNNRVLFTWEDNAIVRERLREKIRPNSMIFTVPLQNGYPAPVRLWLPPGLDVNDTNTKYPMVYYVYSGPNTNTVFDSFTVGYFSYLTTSRNTIYMLADGRGSGLNGQDILFSLNNALGTVEVEDHFVILRSECDCRQVLDRYEFIDRDRVGIWGHSYGGYATLLTLVHDDDHLFQCGVSTAPVTSWLYYNTMYTERYMGLPTPEDNLSGYEAGDVTLLAEKLRGHDFYLMHGNADDNVH